MPSRDQIVENIIYAQNNHYDEKSHVTGVMGRVAGDMNNSNFENNGEAGKQRGFERQWWNCTR